MEKVELFVTVTDEQIEDGILEKIVSVLKEAGIVASAKWAE